MVRVTFCFCLTGDSFDDVLIVLSRIVIGEISILSRLVSTETRKTPKEVTRFVKVWKIVVRRMRGLG